MPFQFERPSLKFGKQKSAAYDLQARANNFDCEDSNIDGSNGQGDHDHSRIHAISIAPNEQLNSYIPNMSSTSKSLATDVIQLTRYKNRRPTVQEFRQERKPSIRNIFLGVPEPERRRFSQDIRSSNLVLAECAALENSETKRVLILQVFIPFLLSGFGNVGAGLFLNRAQKWRVFREETIFYMLLATVMAFKTNLEATFAARLSTCSNLGSMRTWSKKMTAFAGNLALVQTQSIIFGFFASFLVLTFDALISGQILPFDVCLRLLATSMSAIFLNEILSSFIILAVVELSERASVNPDNVSTLIAAMFGDFSSVVFVSIGASYFHSLDPQVEWIFITIIIGLVGLLPFTIYIANVNPFTKGMFLTTHIPLALAVSVATISGLVFEHAVRSFARIAIYQAVVNGVSVNLMAVQASRISTYLQQLNSIAPHRAREYANKCSPLEALYAQDMNASVSRWLIGLCIPAMSVYLCFIFLVAPIYVDVTLYLIACSLIAIVVQVTIIQCLTYLVTPNSWKLDWDPDNVVIPVLMSISDCSGNAILLMAFVFLRYVSDPNSVGHAGSDDHPSETQLVPVL